MSLYFQGGVIAQDADGLTHDPILPVTGGSALFCSTGCSIVIKPSWYNAVASELTAIPDKLGIGYDCTKVTNAADALVFKFNQLTESVNKKTPEAFAPFIIKMTPLRRFETLDQLTTYQIWIYDNFFATEPLYKGGVLQGYVSLVVNDLATQQVTDIDMTPSTFYAAL